MTQTRSPTLRPPPALPACTTSPELWALEAQRRRPRTWQRPCWAAGGQPVWEREDRAPGLVSGARGAVPAATELRGRGRPAVLMDGLQRPHRDPRTLGLDVTKRPAARRPGGQRFRPPLPAVSRRDQGPVRAFRVGAFAFASTRSSLSWGLLLRVTAPAEPSLPALRQALGVRPS